MTKKKNKTEKAIENIQSLSEAIEILKILAKDSDISKKILSTIDDYYDKVDPEDIEESVYSDLDFIDVEEIWDSAWWDSYWWYSSPEDVGYELAEWAVEPHIKNMNSYQKFWKHDQAKDYCIWIIKGLKRFQKESNSKAKDYFHDELDILAENALWQFEKNYNVSNDTVEILKLL